MVPENRVLGLYSAQHDPQGPPPHMTSAPLGPTQALLWLEGAGFEPGSAHPALWAMEGSVQEGTRGPAWQGARSWQGLAVPTPPAGTRQPALQHP